MSLPRRFAAAGILSALLLGSASCKELANRGFATRATLLEQVLTAPTEEQYRTALRVYGPVEEGDLERLDRQSKSEQPQVRRRAAYLLTWTRTGSALAVLRARVADTNDPQVYMVAVVALSGELEAPQLARSRPELLIAALGEDDPQVLATALRVAALAALPNIHEVLARALKHPSETVRAAAIRAVRRAGVGPLEPQLKALLQSATASSDYSFATLYELLSDSDDPSMATVFRDSLKGATDSRESDFCYGVQASRKPWLRPLLLELARADSRNRWNAFRRLSAWRQPDTQRELVALCASLLEKAPPPDDLGRQSYLVEVEPCRELLGKLAGRAAFAWDDYDAALAAARQLLLRSQ